MEETAMVLAITAEPVPLDVDAHGTVRVAGTRLTLDSVLAVYHEHKTAEEIANSFDGLALADVHAILAYYLRHQAEVDAYLAAQERQAEAVWREIDARQGPSALRRRLAAQRHQPAG
jgi:uncharacterized protein (DUF433 family)